MHVRLDRLTFTDFYSSLVALTQDAENLIELNLDTPRGGSCKVVIKTPEDEMEEEFVGGEDGGPLLYRVSLSGEQVGEQSLDISGARLEINPTR